MGLQARRPAGSEDLPVSPAATGLPERLPERPPVDSERLRVDTAERLPERLPADTVRLPGSSLPVDTVHLPGSSLPVDSVRLPAAATREDRKSVV